MTIELVGPPRVGKTALMNALCGPGAAGGTRSGRPTDRAMHTRKELASLDRGPAGALYDLLFHRSGKRKRLGRSTTPVASFVTAGGRRALRLRRDRAALLEMLSYKPPAARELILAVVQAVREHTPEAYRARLSRFASGLYLEHLLLDGGLSGSWVLDEGLLQYLLSAVAELRARGVGFEVSPEAYAGLSSADLIVLLQLPPDQALKRYSARGTKRRTVESTGEPATWFAEMHALLQQCGAAVPPENLLTIDATRPPEQAAAEVRARVAPLET